jgi:hypothetical protein
MPSQQTSPPTVPAAAAPLAQLSPFLWKPPLLTGIDPLHSPLAWRKEGATMQPFYALQPLDKRSQLIVDSHDAIVFITNGIGTDRVRSSLSSDP